VAQSPALSSPLSTPSEERPHPATFKRSITTSSRPQSPGHRPRSVTSSFSSVDSLHSTHTGRLLTLHLEKDQSIIWPALIVGPIDVSLSPCAPNPFVYDLNLEKKYNMDPTSLVLSALELFDIRRDKEEAFEYLIRAWHQARVPSATMRLTTHYLSSQTTYDFGESEEVVRGTTTYYLQCIGGTAGLAQLYLEAGMLHLEGAAKPLLSPTYSTLSSIRMPPQVPLGEDGNDAWKRDREAAIRYFDRARSLQPNLNVPVIPFENAPELEMPSMEIDPSAPASVYSGDSLPDTGLRRRRKKEEMSLKLNEAKADDIDDSWYIYLPGLIGAGTALLVVGVVGALSFSTWRRNQGS